MLSRGCIIFLRQGSSTPSFCWLTYSTLPTLVVCLLVLLHVWRHRLSCAIYTVSNNPCSPHTTPTTPFVQVNLLPLAWIPLSTRSNPITHIPRCQQPLVIHLSSQASLYLTCTSSIGSYNNKSHIQQTLAIESTYTTAPHTFGQAIPSYLARPLIHSNSSALNGCFYDNYHTSHYPCTPCTLRLNIILSFPIIYVLPCCPQYPKQIM